MGFATERIILVITALAALLLMCGCSSMPHRDTVPPLRTYEDIIKGDGSRLFEINDSIEGFNRGAYRFNYYFDEYFFIPIVHIYEFILPDYAEDRISNAIDNINEFGNLTNNLFQLKFKGAGITLSRFAINSTVGVAGLWDHASAWGLKRQAMDFGKTLRHYEVGSGAYIVLPILGPSNIRDTTGLIADTATFSLAGPAALANNAAITTAFSGTSAVDKRHRVSFRYRQTGSPFEYELLRMLNTMKDNYDTAN